MPHITISVRNLVEFVLRSGDLGGGGFFTTRDRALEGTRGHRRIQKLRPPEYQAEVPVSHRLELDGVTLDIIGRVDGIMTDDEGVLIEEIKTVTREFESDPPDNPVHWAQAKTYAWIIATQQGLDTIDIRLTYARLDPWHVREDRRSFTRDDLTGFIDGIVDRYLRWAQPYHEWSEHRDASISSLTFPFPEYRHGQRRLAVAAYRTIEAGCRLFVQAPTGIGKTISVLFPTVKAMAEGHVEKIFYLTAKTVVRTVAEKAVDDLRGNGLAIKSVTLTARDKICFNPHNLTSCDPEQCEFAIGYFDRVNDAVTDTFQCHAMPRQVIEEYAGKHTVCPFELSLDMALWADVIICDYNYVFDPRVYLRRFFQDQTGRYAFLIDEAHNLVDRAREMFSAELYKQEVLDLRRHIKPHHPVLARRLSAINTYFVSLRKRCESEDAKGVWVEHDLPEDLLPLMRKFVDTAEEILARNIQFPYREELLEYYFQAVAFQRIADLFDDHYITYAERHGKDVYLRLFCLDPSKLIHEALQRAAAAIFYSATLTPLTYFRNILGGEEDDPLLSLDSPFPADHFRLIVADHISTTYKKRDQTYDDVAEAIASAVLSRRGNYMIYFPSYRYMAEVCGRFQTTHPDVPILVQTSGMSETGREAFLTAFDGERSETLVGFAVMGGIFGEGIDLVGERLVGAVIVGVGLPQVCLERELIRDYFNGQETDGFAYAYMFPGMNRVLQAAGRVIRTPEDRGVVLLIDQRFGHSRYRRLLPPWWAPVLSMRHPDRIRSAVETFWEDE